ncbi:hypothetical protein FHT40_002427 [Mycolicibacterium sp. BK556]|nr:hypothetical protein [Mycolicibacterium sp. BK607]MBB3602766.1 hypothetical protein [Mycolicibacterium sp. BK556]MBB3632961.1 hypothetical protein [Mycolicibacterium sp. BK607]
MSALATSSTPENDLELSELLGQLDSLLATDSFVTQDSDAALALRAITW